MQVQTVSTRVPEPALDLATEPARDQIRLLLMQFLEPLLMS